MLAFADTAQTRSQEVRNDHYRAEQAIAKSQVKRSVSGNSQNGFSLPGGAENNTLLENAFTSAKAGINGLKTRAPVADEAQRKKVNNALADIVRAYMISRRAAHAPVGPVPSDPFMMMIGQIKLKLTQKEISNAELNRLNADLQLAKDYLASWTI